MTDAMDELRTKYKWFCDEWRRLYGNEAPDGSLFTWALINIPDEHTEMTDFRCVKCNKLLAKVDGAKVQIKCPRCGHVNERNESQDGRQSVSTVR